MLIADTAQVTRQEVVGAAQGSNAWWRWP